MRLKKWISLILIAAVMLIPAAGCGKSVQYEAIELVPEGADMLAQIKVSEALRNWQLYSELEGNEKTDEQFEGMKSAFLHETGIDLSDVSKVVIFADESMPEDVEYAGFIIEGNFAGKAVIDEIEKNTGINFSEGPYNDFSLHIDDAGDKAVVRMNNTMIIMGTVDAVKDCIDVAGGTMNPVSGTVMDTYNKLGDVMVKLSMLIPEETQESFTDQPEMTMMPVGLEAFEDMQSLGLAADLGTTALTIKVNLDFSGADSAGKAGESIKTLLDFIAMMSQEQEGADLIKGIEITVGGSTVYLDYAISLADLANMAESFENGAGIPMIPSGPPEDFEFPGWFEDDIELPDDPGTTE